MVQSDPFQCNPSFPPDIHQWHGMSSTSHDQVMDVSSANHHIDVSPWEQYPQLDLSTPVGSLAAYPQAATPLLFSMPLPLEEQQCRPQDWQTPDHNPGFGPGQQPGKLADEGTELSDCDYDDDGPESDFEHPSIQGLARPPIKRRVTGPMRVSALAPGQKSHFRGVSFDKKKRKWRVQIKVSSLGKSGVSVGYYATEEEGARAYDRVAIGLLGRDSNTINTNFPVEEYDAEAIMNLRGKSREEVKTLLKSERARIPRVRRCTSRRRTSRFYGVGSSNRKNQWQARISVHNKVTHLGYYATEVDAAQAYDRVYLALNGRDAPMFNFPPDRYDDEPHLRNCSREDLQRALGVKPMDKSSIYRGVSKKKGKWEAKVMVDRKWAYRELFPTEIEAARAYDREVRRLTPGEAKSKVNFPDEEELSSSQRPAQKGIKRAAGQAATDPPPRPFKATRTPPKRTAVSATATALEVAPLNIIPYHSNIMGGPRWDFPTQMPEVGESRYVQSDLDSPLASPSPAGLDHFALPRVRTQDMPYSPSRLSDNHRLKKEDHYMGSSHLGLSLQLHSQRSGRVPLSRLPSGMHFDGEGRDPFSPLARGVGELGSPKPTGYQLFRLLSAPMANHNGVFRTSSALNSPHLLAHQMSDLLAQTSLGSQVFDLDCLPSPMARWGVGPPQEGGNWSQVSPRMGAGSAAHPIASQAGDTFFGVAEGNWPPSPTGEAFGQLPLTVSGPQGSLPANIESPTADWGDWMKSQDLSVHIGGEKLDVTNRARTSSHDSERSCIDMRANEIFICDSHVEPLIPG